MKQLEEYQFPEKMETMLEELRAYVADVAMEEIMATAEKMINMLEVK